MAERLPHRRAGPRGPRPQRLLRRQPRAAGRRPRASTPASSRSSAATAWARPRSARRSWAWCPSPRGAITFRGESLVGRSPDRDRPARHRLRAAGPPPLALADRRRAPAHGRRRPQGRLDPRPRLLDLSPPRRAQVERRRPAFGRRAADARHRPRAADQPQAARHGRADRGPRPGHRRPGRGRCSCASPRRRASTSSSSSRTSASPPQVADKVGDHGQRPHQPHHRRPPTLAADRDLQQRMLGVGRHGEDEAPATRQAPADADASPTPPAGHAASTSPTRCLPTRWSRPVPPRQIIAAARTLTQRRHRSPPAAELRPLAPAGEQVVLVAGTLDTKGEELRFIRDLIRDAGPAGPPRRPLDHRRASAAPRFPRTRSPPTIRAAPAASSSATAARPSPGMTLAFERWVAAPAGHRRHHRRRRLRQHRDGRPRHALAAGRRAEADRLDRRRRRRLGLCRPLRHHDDACRRRHPGAERASPAPCSATPPPPWSAWSRPAARPARAAGDDSRPSR